MRAVDLIQKKRNGQSLTFNEIAFLIKGYCQGTIPDYQMSAWAMAIFFQGMSKKETADLTMAMAHSGDTVDLSPIHGLKADKHSTGGVGDKTTLIVAPLVAAIGIPVAKMSGKGLGHTGGTIDKLESIPGLRTELPREAFFEQVNEIGIAIVGQSGNLTPADKKLYALRDVTATVESIPLIASSVMSKKIAAGADAIVLDVKTGSGAFMKTVEEAEELALAMVDIGTEVGRKTAAVISDMDQPLGFAIGNALEVTEAIATLRGQGPADLEQLCITLAAHMAVLTGRTDSIEEAESLLRDALHSGAALAKFRAFVEAQGGDARIADQPELLPQAPETVSIVAEQDGWIASIQAEMLGLAAMKLGAGRAKKDDIIDYSVGITLRKKVGEAVTAGDVLADLHINDQDGLEAIKQEAATAFTISTEPPQSRPLLLSIVTADGITRLS
ncbi:pyrimidine-nucleoside phosphorylase [Paenibacillus cellulosilyticus]|uniref:Pyrimidine-nucleoside phosphorylase n=1 Tax=Paenibacillus cellulosilyticus TaxID=375489 RepID=A0A2V2Z577_9BACL|nr:pyrimidine-nucleoside phosphorylase [Paenibacillus cellulosilyticus]PWW05619.1 pyrimidine-nucleoside phosphorylase [Paenibacillus cellulosilyticus]QKS45352.1 pyrimidine-nucleoside phosphorylase [Paenibacillus cellulosilyticus]